MKETILCMCKNVVWTQPTMSRLRLMAKENFYHISEICIPAWFISHIWPQTKLCINLFLTFQKSSSCLWSSEVSWEGVDIFFPPEVAVMATHHQTECLWGASLINQSQLNLQCHCLLHVGDWKENLPVMLHKILHGPHLPYSISFVNLHHNRCLEALYWMLWVYFATVTTV